MKILLKSHYHIIVILFLLSACTTENTKPISFTDRIDKGEVLETAIDEASGLAYSRNYTNSLWIHNDSGDDARLFLINENAVAQGFITLEGATNRDWEDMAIARFNNANQLFVADIGDNSLQYDDKYLYYFAEPSTVFNATFNIPSSSITKITLQYPDGKKDAEALMIDEKANEFYIISKEGTQASVYKASIPLPNGDLDITMEKVATLPYGNITAADISADGLEVLVKTYSNVYYWKRQDINTSIASLLQNVPTVLSYTPEIQGEAIAWHKDQLGYFTLSEKSFSSSNPRLYFYQRN